MTTRMTLVQLSDRYELSLMRRALESRARTAGSTDTVKLGIYLYHLRQSDGVAVLDHVRAFGDIAVGISEREFRKSLSRHDYGLVADVPSLCEGRVLIAAHCGRGCLLVGRIAHGIVVEAAEHEVWGAPPTDDREVDLHSHFTREASSVIVLSGAFRTGKRAEPWMQGPRPGIRTLLSEGELERYRRDALASQRETLLAARTRATLVPEELVVLFGMGDAPRHPIPPIKSSRHGSTE